MDDLKNAGFDMFPFFEMTPDLVCIADKAGYFKKVNPSVIEKLGYTEEELFSKPIASFIHPDDKALTASTRAELLNGKALINFQNRYLTKSGNFIWLQWTSIYFAEKEVVFAIAKEVTEKKLIEKEVEEKYKKFKSLTTHFKQHLEKDKKYIAVELHEDLAQLASVAKMEIGWVNDNTPNLPQASKTRLEHALAVSNLLINTMRKISFSISPNMLYDVGLHETLEWMCNEFSSINGINCVFENNYDEELLTHETKLDFFRISQEALRNVVAHAQASHVKISIDAVDDKVRLCI
ncbi:MAG: PAS domain S-box protein, partial [Bacteroidota bacterium]